MSSENYIKILKCTVFNTDMQEIFHKNVWNKAIFLSRRASENLKIAAA
jgi:hypothetical protein